MPCAGRSLEIAYTVNMTKGSTMNQTQGDATSANNIWIRALFMILFGLLYSLAGTVVIVVAVFQFVITLLGGTPNPRLLAFGRSLAVYIQQLVQFQTFNTEQKPFPFMDWPS